MQAMVLERSAAIETSPLRPAEWPVPEPAAGEVRLRVRCCAICRTDLHVIEGDLPARKRPLVPGHQVVGVVDALGPGCTRLRIGQRIGVAWLRHTCGQCGFCRRGRENLCRSPRFTGYDADGGFAEYAVVPEAFAYEIPPAFADADAAPLLCAGIIGYRALQRAELPPGGRLGLYGFGSSAHVVIQLARHRGSEAYVVTRGPQHRDLARRLGATWVGADAAELPVKVDSAILFAPAGELVPPALEHLEHGGTLVLAGIYLTAVPGLRYERHLFHERDLRCVTANTRADGRALLAEAAAIPIRPQVTRYPLAGANQALQDLKADRLSGTGVLLVAAD
jgi:propanol-preferring alcohol dehydrogenase